MLSLRCSLRSAAVLAACAVTLQAAVPTGWFFAGSKPKEYDCSLDPTTSYQNLPSTYIKSKVGVKTTGFGSMMQEFSASPYIGKRIRLSGYMKSEDVTSWGGLWMRIDDANHPRNGYPSMVGFDNMHDGLEDKSVKGTTDWQSCSIVLDVPEGATGIYIGFLLEGPGALWVSGMKLDVVGKDVPVTGRPPMAPSSHDAPVNLGFDK